MANYAFDRKILKAPVNLSDSCASLAVHRQGIAPLRRGALA